MLPQQTNNLGANNELAPFHRLLRLRETPPPATNEGDNMAGNEEICAVCKGKIVGCIHEYVTPEIRIAPLCINCMGLHVNHEWGKLNEILNRRRTKQ